MVSEFMLQQTQVETVLPYFERWVARFPDLPSLAAAEEAEVEKLWEGLGYYSRARNLLKAARAMVGEGRARPPDSVEELLRYPGFGPYTAGAVASIAGNGAVAAVDGNVERVMARFGDLEDPAGSAGLKRMAAEIVLRMMPEGKARAFNQALMELGALACLPKAPRCEKCPLWEFCLARKRGTEAQRPLPRRRPATIKIDAWAVLWRHTDACLLRRRPAGGVWARLWEIPWFSRDAENTRSAVDAHARELGVECLSFDEAGVVRFSFTRHRVTAWFVVCGLREISPSLAEKIEAGEWGLFSMKELSSLTLPAPTRKCLALLSDIF
ncbi:MAG: NUDIX domain-containing protein [Synergistaceae bacterium]|jgi:A/G-specific adenine glycosylase|nr:NUDIX domain-containing protein [Synergistaceae bacterium]